MSEPVNHDVRTVVLLHGLWMTGLELSLLGSRLERAGFNVARFRYPMVRKSFAAHVAGLKRFIDGVGEGRPVHLVGHSLGGVLGVSLLLEHPDAVARLVALGSPFRGSWMAEQVARLPGGKLALGKSLNTLMNGVGGGEVVTPERVGVIAGTHALGVGKFLFRGLEGANDGVVSVAETLLPGASGRQAHANHLGLVLSREVAALTALFLETGAFDQEASSS